MIQIENIHIHEIRGIRDLSLTFGSKSFVIIGPNGAGKSGVVDAIDFLLTGNIHRLTGAGSGGLTLTKHGPHVHRRDDPGDAYVTATVHDPVKGKTAMLMRNIRTANSYSLDPDSQDMRALIEQTQQHPELMLSRREIIKYIVAEAGKRSQEVQALLKLDRFGEIRAVLRTVQTKTSSAHRTAQDHVHTSEDSLKRHLDLSSLLETEVLFVVNEHRAVLGLPALATLNSGANLAEGIGADFRQEAFNKASAIRDIVALLENVTSSSPLPRAAIELTQALEVLEAKPGILDALQHRDLVSAGMPLITDAHCPLCDLAWPDVESLRAHLAQKLALSEEAAYIQDQVLTRAAAVRRASYNLRTSIQAVKPIATSDGVQDLHLRMQAWSDDLVAFEASLISVETALSQQQRLKTNPLTVTEEVIDGLASLKVAIEKKPDQTVTATAKSFLIVAQERWIALRLARADLRKRAAAQRAAQAIYETYCVVQNELLTNLYHTVEQDFSRYYRELNVDDEPHFKAQLEPSAGKLGLNVDFYGAGMFPPAAYHSEGHQDGMGVCLYLALIKRLLGSNFRFAALDDVVMSIDSSHRKQFCNLLKANFPDVQFIITTHDEVWAQQMRYSGLVPKTAIAKFHSWTVDGGPIYEEGDFWDKIDADLAGNDVPAAAARLRRNLELIMTELATSLRGQVTYRPDGRYELSDLLSSVKGAYGKWLSRAANSANSWNDSSAKSRVDSFKSAWAKANLAQESENWALNPAVHFNDWASFTKADFTPVLAAWKQFLNLFTCDNLDCTGLIYIVGDRGKERGLRCGCGSLNLNLQPK
jgi:energy-coupling factor transporter ATP-binding protein EcfA2